MPCVSIPRSAGIPSAVTRSGDRRWAAHGQSSEQESHDGRGVGSAGAGKHSLMPQLRGSGPQGCSGGPWLVPRVFLVRFAVDPRQHRYMSLFHHSRIEFLKMPSTSHFSGPDHISESPIRGLTAMPMVWLGHGHVNSLGDAEIYTVFPFHDLVTRFALAA